LIVGWCREDFGLFARTVPTSTDCGDSVPHGGVVDGLGQESAGPVSHVG
jgi:hypothetical protein